MTLKRLSNIAILAFKNGIRLHKDSLKLFALKSYPSAAMLSVLAMEEFGKYFSLSSYVFYTRISNTRDLIEEEQYLLKLYEHVFKQATCISRDGFKTSEKLFNQARKRYFEDLKQKSIYVGLKRDKGKVKSDEPYNNPLKVDEKQSRKQVKFLNDLLIEMIELHLNGNIKMDENDVNDMLSYENMNELLSYRI